MKKLVFCLFFLVLFSKNTFAQIVDSMSFNWSIYEMPDPEDQEFKLCYMVANPISSDTDHSSRKKPYLMITRFQKTRSEEISVYGGYEFKLNSNIFLLIDSYQFRLKTKNEIAWAKTKQEDINIIQTILNGSKVRIRSDSAIGTYAIDEYSLKGIVKAYGRIRAICQ
jgi:hypothetical protein